MIRSTSLAVALAAATACVAQDDQTSSVAQATGGGFQCQNKASISGIQCSGDISVFNIILSVKNVGVLDINKINILGNDLNTVRADDSNSLDDNKITNDLRCVTASDFLNRFQTFVAPTDICTSNPLNPFPICGCMR